MKEISKTGGPGATRRYNNETGRAVKRRRGKTSYARPVSLLYLRVAPGPPVLLISFK